MNIVGVNLKHIISSRRPQLLRLGTMFQASGHCLYPHNYIKLVGLPLRNNPNLQKFDSNNYILECANNIVYPIQVLL